MNGKKTLYCNKCGREITKEQGMAGEGILEVEWEWGYFSGKDGERHRFCLCERCYDKLRETFAVPVEVEEYL